MEGQSYNLVKPWIVVCLLLWTQLVHAQNAGIKIADTNMVMDMLQRAVDSSETRTDKSLEITDSALALSRQLSFQFGLATGLNLRSNICRVLGKVADAVNNAKESIEISKANHFERNTADALNNLANAYDDISEYEKATSNYVAALNIYERLKDSANMAHTYGNMGVLMQHTHNYAKAVEYYNKAILLGERLKQSTAFLYAALGGSYVEQRKYQEAFRVLRKGLATAEREQNTDAAPTLYLNLGLCYDETGKKDSALHYYFIALSHYKELRDAVNEAAILNDIGSVYMEQGKLADAQKYLQQSLALAKLCSNKMTMWHNYGNLAAVAGKHGDYKQAYQYMELRSDVRDSMLNEQNVRSLQELTTRFETKEMEERNVLLKKENDLQLLRLKQKDILLYGALAGVALLLGMAVLLLRQNKLLRSQQRIELAHKQLYAQMNPHFIFNCLSSIQNFILQSDTKNANRYLTNFANLMRLTLENSKTTTITLREELKYLQNYLAMEHLRFENKFSYEIKCDENADKDSIEIPPMMVQPFAENAIRHGLSHYKNNEGRLVINFYVKEDALYCEIDDNGIGRERSLSLKEQTGVGYRSQGMEVTKERLELVSKIKKADYSATVIDKTDGIRSIGTTVVIKFPVQI